MSPQLARDPSLRARELAARFCGQLKGVDARYLGYRASDRLQLEYHLLLLLSLRRVPLLLLGIACGRHPLLGGRGAPLLQQLLALSYLYSSVWRIDSSVITSLRYLVEISGWYVRCNAIAGDRFTAARTVHPQTVHQAPLNS